MRESSICERVRLERERGTRTMERSFSWEMVSGRVSKYIRACQLELVAWRSTCRQQEQQCPNRSGVLKHGRQRSVGEASGDLEARRNEAEPAVTVAWTCAGCLVPRIERVSQHL